jgi:hypothetical protein
MIETLFRITIPLYEIVDKARLAVKVPSGKELVTDDVTFDRVSRTLIVTLKSQDATLKDKQI